ncbi:HTTM domain-containing protein [Halobiforma nitratireducens]|uniref:HTTM-like domain-containing protein n=1 Tax=Halobiforma nitratireducens JCM 10879 TaxID=1227454 RepID=M0MA80_9EURY|nr:HTTM domain-containing protein [Halobiforma nitratireducens]EMA42258.1 hypothetical protein C446_04425 [Halobiforma nitratireducens JCM 10879]
MGDTFGGLSDRARRARERLANPSYVDPAFVRIDTRSLAAFRILAALLIVADILLRARNFTFFYTEAGVVPQSLATELTADGAFSVYYYTTDATVIGALFAIQVLFALQLLVGYKTRLATVLSFLLVVSLDHHNPLVLSYADVLFRLLLFWSIFLPLGERWSIDALHSDASPRTGVTSLASAAILTQMIFMYFLNGYHKTESDLWIGGEATPLIMGLDNTTFLLGDFTRHVPTLLQYGGLTWYYILLFSWLLVLLRGRARTLFAAIFLGGHASFALTVRIGAFPYVAIAGLVLFLQTSFWKDTGTVLRAVPAVRSRAARASTRLERLGHRVPAATLRSGLDSPPVEVGRVTRAVYSLALIVAVVSVLVVPALSYMPLAEAIDEDDGLQERIDERAAIVGVDQPEWSVFAPHPRTSDRYYVFPAETADGGVIDAYSGREMTYDRPYEELQRQFGTYRERFYMGDVRRGSADDAAPELLAEHVCTNWADDRDVDLERVNMYLVVEDVTLETLDDHEDRDRSIDRLYAHGCGTNEPQEIAPPD